MLQVRDGRSHKRAPQCLHAIPISTLTVHIGAQQAASTAEQHDLPLQGSLSKWVSTAEEPACLLAAPTTRHEGG